MAYIKKRQVYLQFKVDGEGPFGIDEAARRCGIRKDHLRCRFYNDKSEDDTFRSDGHVVQCVNADEFWRSLEGEVEESMGHSLKIEAVASQRVIRSGGLLTVAVS